MGTCIYMYLQALQSLWSRCSTVKCNVTISFIFRLKISQAAEDPNSIVFAIKEIPYRGSRSVQGREEQKTSVQQKVHLSAQTEPSCVV